MEMEMARNGPNNDKGKITSASSELDAGSQEIDRQQGENCVRMDAQFSPTRHQPAIDQKLVVPVPWALIEGRTRGVRNAFVRSWSYATVYGDRTRKMAT